RAHHRRALEHAARRVRPDPQPRDQRTPLLPGGVAPAAAHRHQVRRPDGGARRAARAARRFEPVRLRHHGAALTLTRRVTRLSNGRRRPARPYLTAANLLTNPWLRGDRAVWPFANGVRHGSAPSLVLLSRRVAVPRRA